MEINPISGDLILQAGKFDNMEKIFGILNSPFSLAFQTTLSSIGFNVAFQAMFMFLQNPTCTLSCSTN